MPSPRRSKEPPLTRGRASSSFARLRTYVARATLTPEETEFIQALFAPRHLDKGEILQQAGETARHMAFVAQGCLRSYVIDDKGKVTPGFRPSPSAPPIS